ncbi:MAG: sensor histidine kinase [Terracidiphilus sp.]
MQQTEQTTACAAKAERPWNGVERRGVKRVDETLAALDCRSESLSAVAHDARNMVAALGLYCDLLGEPGVFAAGFNHYADELRLVAAASRRLVEKLVALDASAREGIAMPMHTMPVRTSSPDKAAKPAEGGAGNPAGGIWPVFGRRAVANAAARERRRRGDLFPALPIANLAAELLANRNLLAALAGPSITLTVEADGGARPVRLTGEDLTRLLVNLVKNAAEAMPRGGRIRIGLRGPETAGGAAPCLVLTVEDSGPGIPEEALERVFAAGYTTRPQTGPASGWAQSHHGLGLTIVRSIVEGAGGRITATNCVQGGACFTIELPVGKAGTREQGLGTREQGTGNREQIRSFQEC